MLKSILLVGTGGFIGSVLRYLVQVLIDKNQVGDFPLGTLIANVAGSFIIGVVLAFADKGNMLSGEWKLFLAVGICGGFTTFSTFAFNNLNMLRENEYGQLFLNIGGSLVFGILAVYLGFILVRAIF